MAVLTRFFAISEKNIFLKCITFTEFFSIFAADNQLVQGMKKMKVQSFRLDESDIEIIDKMAARLSYDNRSDVVRAAVQFLFRYATHVGYLKIMAGYRQNWKDYNFTITDEQL